MIFKTAYDTSVCRGYDQRAINDSIVKSLIQGQTQPVKKDIFAVVEGNLAKPFPHPFYTTESNRNHGFAIDVRQYLKDSSVSGEELNIRIRNKSEYELLINRAILNKVFLIDYNELTYIHPGLMTIYAEWISSNIGKRFALDYREMTIIKSLCALYYLSLFTHEKDWNEYFTANALLKINQVMKIPSVAVKEYIMDIENPLTTIDSLIELIKEKCDNIRLNGLTPGILISIISSTWFGNNHAELLAVALEHPPTFVALVYTAINDTLYRRIGFSQVVTNVLKSEAKQTSIRILELLDI